MKNDSGEENREKYVFDINGSVSEGLFSFFYLKGMLRYQQAGLLGQRQKSVGQFSKFSFYGPGSCYQDNIPTGGETAFLETVRFPDAAAGTVTHHGMAQLLADGNADIIVPGTIGAGVQNQIRIGNPLGTVKPPENVIFL